MSKFVQAGFSATHSGVDRVENAVSFFTTYSLKLIRFDSSRGLAALLVAALVAALMVVANQVIGTITDGHLLAAWMGLWFVGFVAIALLARPARLWALQLRADAHRAREARRLAQLDAQMWRFAQYDARVMAEIRAAMTRS